MKDVKKMKSFMTKPKATEAEIEALFNQIDEPRVVEVP